MHPVLLVTPWFNVYSYGFLLAVGYTVAIILTCYKAKKNSLDPGAIFDLMLMQLVVGVLGSRLLFVLEYVPQKLLTIDFLAFEQGGLTFYGSVITGFIFDLLYLKFRGFPFWKSMDAIGFGLGPGIAVARIGCFLNGCCYGIACSPSIGFQFRGSGPGYYHATQIYESILCLVAFAIIFWFGKKRQTHYGQTFLGFISLYAFFRFFIEFIRAENPVFLLGMTLSQVLSIVFITASIIVWKYNLKNKELEIMPEMKAVSLEEIK
ncbi:MAG: prolipoprotein diacylglyceryl transferase [Candidatus Riflebacteria bacterium]|nr:prolipoprotein diacylglyceryl transferase [Candidatus Riflebacteria bacterium]